MNKLSRRTFITSGLLASGALIIGVAVRPGHRVPRLIPLVTDESETLINAWVKISTDNSVTVIVPHCEMGQGVHTSLPMMLAEEMELDWKSVNVMEAPAEEEYANYALARGFIIGDTKIPKALVQTVNGGFLEITQLMKLQITGGSTAIRHTGIHAMKMAGAAAKQMLVESAANTWKVPVNEITAKLGQLSHKQSGNSARYADFTEAASQMTPPSAPLLKSPKDYQIVGHSQPRLDLCPKLDGSAKFGIDYLADDLLFSAISIAPVFSEVLMAVDDQKARSMPGVVKIVSLENAVAVVAKSYWQASQALKQLSIKWTPKENENAPNNQASSESIFTQFRADLKLAEQNDEQQLDFEKGDIHSAKALAKKIVKAEYQVPYLAHATMEPLNCTAQIKNGHCRLWTGCQNPLGFRAEVAEALDFDLDQVSLINHYLGGGFGRRAIADYAIYAAQIARQLDSPVKLIWSREQDTQHDHYRQANISQFTAGLDEQGYPLFWQNIYLDKHDPEEAPHIPYAIDHQLIQYVDSPTHIPFGPWRSVDHSLHAFFTESFIDELAHHAKQDPFIFRQSLLKQQPRMLNVLNAVAKLSDWDLPLAKNVGRGIAIHRSFNSIVAQVAEVSVIDGTLNILKVYCVVDVGLAINPDGLKAQMESGIIFGLTAALYGEITIKDGAVTQANFDDYPILRMAQSPRIEVAIINSGHSLGGGGEPGTPPIAPAVANAVFALTGKRLRKLPLGIN